MCLRVGVGAVAADGGDVELVVAPLFAVQRVAHTQPRLVLVYHHYLERDRKDMNTFIRKMDENDVCYERDQIIRQKI